MANLKDPIACPICRGLGYLDDERGQRQCPRCRGKGQIASSPFPLPFWLRATLVSGVLALLLIFGLLIVRFGVRSSTLPVATHPPTSTALASTVTPTPTGTASPGATSTPIVIILPGGSKATATPTPTATPRPTLQVIDDLNDWSKPYNHSGQLAINFIGPDRSTVNRTKDVLDAENIVWSYPHITRTTIRLYYCTVPGAPGTGACDQTDVTMLPFTFRASTDGVSWQTVSASCVDTPPAVDLDWTTRDCTMSSLDAHFVQVIWPVSPPTQIWWSPVVGQATFFYQP